MKVKIEKLKNTTKMYINGVQYGEHISGYKIEQEGIQKPTLTLKIHCDEILFDCDDVEIKKEQTK
ncbi:MAG: hypothetical protein V8Q75_06445 [Bacilli bacterium]